jgi:hypothetical protein
MLYKQVRTRIALAIGSVDNRWSMDLIRLNWVIDQPLERLLIGVNGLTIK